MLPGLSLRILSGKLVCVCLNCKIFGSEFMLASMAIITLYDGKFKKGIDLGGSKITSNGVRQ